MATIDSFFPCYIDEFKDDVAKRAKRLSQESNERLILHALGLIMDEQQRTGNRSPGWPDNEHQATRFVLHNRTEE